MGLSHKDKARLYHQAVSAYDAATVEALVHPDYIQHNPRVPTGRAAFLALLPRLREHGSKIRNLHILQDGDFVAMLHLWSQAWLFGADRMLAFHVLRFDASGLIAEHWSVMKPMAEGHAPDPAARLVTRHKLIVDGDLALSISEGRRDGRPVAIYDLARQGAGSRSERWQIVNEIPVEGLANENSMFGF